MMARTTAVARRTTGGLMKNKTGQTKKVSGKNSGMQHMDSGNQNEAQTPMNVEILVPSTSDAANKADSPESPAAAQDHVETQNDAEDEEAREPRQHLAEKAIDEQQQVETELIPEFHLKTKKKLRQSTSKKCGLTFPPRRVLGKLRKTMSNQMKMGMGTGVYLAAVLEYLAAEVLELAGDFSKQDKRRRITPRHVQLAVLNDPEIGALCSSVTIAEGGVLPNINAFLLPKKKT